MKRKQTKRSVGAKKRAAMKQESVSLRDTIVLYKRVLSPQICSEIIERFEHDPRRQPSATAAGILPSKRQGVQVKMENHPEWADLKKTVTDKLIQCLYDYAGRFQAIEFILKFEDFELSSPIIERASAGQGFDWHIDSGPHGTARRFLSALMYLNAVNDGGQTEFPMQGLSVAPRQGTTVIFPPYWMYPHRGIPPTQEPKYKLTAYFMIVGKDQAID
jgi:hypothetical protein